LVIFQRGSCFMHRLAWTMSLVFNLPTELR
jgi:hypothetical protein